MCVSLVKLSNVKNFKKLVQLFWSSKDALVYRQHILIDCNVNQSHYQGKEFQTLTQYHKVIPTALTL